MPEELKTERVTIMMTPSEVNAIDDWSFARRIRSRGEAVRRLIEMSLEPAKQKPTKQTKAAASGKTPASD
jgi:metal-responsive CopG/Arc/MetJ family transcriptional regulator